MHPNDRIQQHINRNAQQQPQGQQQPRPQQPQTPALPSDKAVWKHLNQMSRKAAHELKRSSARADAESEVTQRLYRAAAATEAHVGYAVPSNGGRYDALLISLCLLGIPALPAFVALVTL